MNHCHSLYFKDKLRSFFNGECSVEDLVQHSGLKKEAVVAILEKHNAFRDDENGKSIIFHLFVRH